MDKEESDRRLKNSLAVARLCYWLASVGEASIVGSPGAWRPQRCEEVEELYEILRSWAGSLWQDEAGASLVEYILMVALVAVVCIAAITFLGKSAKSKFEFTANAINTAG
jgi:Flp pilus assembly pilin Flp